MLNTVQPELASEPGADMRSMFSADRLAGRPARPPDHAAENRALLFLASEMAASPSTVLQKLAETALELVGAQSAGISLMQGPVKDFYWAAIAGAWARHAGGGTPRDFGPCGTVVDRNMAMLCSHPELDFPYFAEVSPGVEEALLIPFYIKDKAAGTIWVVMHDASRRFDTEDLRLMNSLATFMSAAYHTYTKLADVEERAAIVESSNDAIISKDLSGTIKSWNKAAERIFGYAASEAVGKPITMLIPDDRLSEESEIIARITRGERIEHFETIRRRKDGRLIDISLMISPVSHYPGGPVVGASKIARDVTERNRAFAELKRAENDLREFVEDASVGMHWVGPDGKIIWANRCELAMLGYAPEEYIGRHIAEFHADEKVIGDILSRLSGGETLINYEARLRCKDGSLRDVLINSNVRWEGDKFVHTRCFTRDVSERKNFEKRIELLGREAEHRAKNVLATVQAIVHLTQAATPTDVKKAIAGRIRALANVHTLFTDSHWKGADLRSLVAEEIAPYSQDGDERVRVEGPAFVLDPPRAQTIAMAMHELATNAAKYGALSTPEGRVAVEWEVAPDGVLKLAWTERGGPPVQIPDRKGFGTAVLENMIRGQSKGEMIMDWRTEGLACEITLPASA